MNKSMKTAPFARRTLATAVLALCAAGASAQYAHSPNTNENPITGNLPKALCHRASTRRTTCAAASTPRVITTGSTTVR